jgi:hypothetical protein
LLKFWWNDIALHLCLADYRLTWYRCYVVFLSSFRLWATTAVFQVLAQLLFTIFFEFHFETCSMHLKQWRSGPSNQWLLLLCHIRDILFRSKGFSPRSWSKLFEVSRSYHRNTLTEKKITDR